MSSIRIRLLGSFEVRRGTTALAVPAGRQRALLALLALRGGHVVDVESIADTLWDGRPPRGARTTIRGFVGRLRRVLDEPGAESVIGTGAGGYRLRVIPSDVDVHRFRSLVAAARAEQDPDRELVLLERAADCWQGDLLAEVGCPELLRRAEPALEEQRLLVVQRRMDLLIGRGDAAPAVAELRSLVAEHPLRERFWEQLMTALHRAGRPAEALQAYESCRGALAAELGVDPGPRLRELHAEILLADAVRVPRVPALR